MTDDTVVTMLRESAHALTDDVNGRADSLTALFEDRGRAPRPVRRPVRRLAPAFTVVGAGAAVAGLLAVGLTGVGRSGPVPAPPASTGPGAAVLSTGPFPTSDHFLAAPPRQSGPPAAVIVRASDGRTVALLPTGAHALVTPVLSPDGTTVYGVSATTPARMLAYNISTRRTTVLDTRRGILIGPSISADGSTLAYEWSAVLGDPEHSTSVVVRTLRTGAVHVIGGAPGGPQVLSMALSPDGSRLAVVPTVTTTRPVLVVSTSATSFSGAATVAGTRCGSDRTAEPRWTVRALYVMRFCDGVELMRIDPATLGAQVLHRFGPDGFYAYAPLPGTDADRFAVSDDTQSPSRAPVMVLDPQRGWQGRTVPGVAGVTEVTSE